MKCGHANDQSVGFGAECGSRLKAHSGDVVPCAEFAGQVRPMLEQPARQTVVGHVGKEYVLRVVFVDVAGEHIEQHGLTVAAFQMFPCAFGFRALCNRLQAIEIVLGVHL